MTEFTFQATSEADTNRLAETLAAACPPGMTIGLSGTLGAGKTRFAQAFAEACGVERQAVVSPTYIICQSYATERFQLNHLDVYRLTSQEEFLDLGAEEMFALEGVQLIEWAERVRELLPEDRLDIEIVVTGETEREFQMRAYGPRSIELLTTIQTMLS